jgi:putative SOS response-associated peptidase YedK
MVFFEWKRPGVCYQDPSIIYRFVLKIRMPFVFAGLWESCKSTEGSILQTCTVITTTANEVVAPSRDRMPVMLCLAEGWEWLSEQSPQFLNSSLRPFPENEMESYPVSKIASNPKFDHPNCIMQVVE